MATTIILNGDGGTIRGIDAAEFADRAAECLSRAYGDCAVHLIGGNDLIATLDKAAGDPDTKTIVAGGGDGTISAAASACFRTGKTLGVLPLGTMNLFARSLGIPLDPMQALEAIAAARARPLDIATANDRPFIHQFSAGLHARLVRQRNRLDTSTRMRKIAASFRSLGRVISDPPSLHVEIESDGVHGRERVSAIAVSNNLFAETPLAYAAKLDAGVMGLYRSRALSPGNVLRTTLNTALGKMQSDRDVEVDAVKRVSLRFAGKRDLKAAIDGEIVPLEDEVEFVCHAGALNVLVPEHQANA